MKRLKLTPAIFHSKADKVILSNPPLSVATLYDEVRTFSQNQR